MSIRGIDTVQLVVHGQAAGQAIKNVFHYVSEEITPDPLDVTIEELVSTFRTAWRAAVLPLLCNNYFASAYSGVVIEGTVVLEHPDETEYTALKLGDVSTLDGEVGEDEGGSADASLPTEVALTIQKKTGKAGRENHGSTRFAPIGATSLSTVNRNQWSAGTLAAFSAAQAFIQGNLTPPGFAGDFVPVVFHRTRLLNAAPPIDGTVNYRTRITGTIVNLWVGSQVSRKQRATLGA